MKRIDIAKILRDKNPSLAPYVPRFVVRWVEKLICARGLNEILELYSTRDAIGFIHGALDYIGVKYELHGTENIPPTGRVIFASNHPLGGVDGMILAAAIEPIRPGVKLIVNDILMNLEPLRPIFVGVNKFGSQGKSFAGAMDSLFESEAPIINFPAGFCSRLGANGICDLQWRKSFVSRSIASSRIVVPTFVQARNSMFFYRVARLRRMLGIKANLELVLLPRQVFFQKGRTVHIFFGKPITMDSSLSTDQWCQKIRQEAYALGDEQTTRRVTCQKK
ncbi:MAG: 1-acyl-sn-glycerol-3-phosphate acyltransferase [Mucinivorans sp.]